ncbi:ABC-type Fe3+-hydroxamate transport system substrate-binding protein [Mesocricetibacter intestinalis]|uniref:ABC-type Fe3+-hydroxamate transport system substrate-binding protein n=1 Tax=Mesocricetibacter intestinalis TaxID=1521930 RepID=A0A4R6V7R8_9PAST|nr:ABC transporter substrate-binding protein [Mesocricetibacter intestinalis]TDQ57396.1 ABC-type Fe3+-hydroxamate transport system substrate-binding protein [Mesocricetibacter intestinalis]
MPKQFKLGALALASLLAFSTSALAKKVELTDVIDRTVTVDVPAKRVVLAFNYQDYMAIAGVKSFDNIVGFSKAVWSDWAPTSWEAFSKAVPRLNQLEDVGEVEVGTFSIEKILALKPDLVVLSDWQYQALDSDLEPLETAGIPVVVIDYLAQTLDKHVKSTEIIGVLTGNEEKAKQLNEEYKAVVKDIQDRIAKANPPKPKVYVEFGNKGPKEFSFTFGKSMWGSMLNLIGADNIAKNAVEFYSPINPELVLAAKPDVVIITGRETELKKNPEAMVMGFNIEESEAEKRLKGFKARPGWSELPAIKSNRLYGAYHANSRTLSDSASIQFVAKAVYPELFADLDPTKTYEEFYRKNLPIVPQGTFYLYPENK